MISGLSLVSPILLGMNYPLKYPSDDEHPFVPPGPTDQRGPCPALNILANHGYINHTGIVSFEEVHYAVQEVFNMEFHFAGFVAGFGMVRTCLLQLMSIQYS